MGPIHAARVAAARAAARDLAKEALDGKRRQWMAGDLSCLSRLWSRRRQAAAGRETPSVLAFVS